MEITEKQKEYVLTHYGIVDTKIIALHLNTTPEYVRTIANRYGIKIKRQWTKEDMDYLRENWGEISLKVMSRKLKRTETAIRKYREMLSFESKHLFMGNTEWERN